MDTPTADFVRAGSLEELKAKGRLVVRGPHRPILVVYDKDRVFALDNRCPHMGFPLDRGVAPINGAARRRLEASGEQARSRLSGSDRLEYRIDFGAYGGGARASRPEPAAAWRLGRIGRLALECERIGDATAADVGDRREQRLRIRVLRRAKQCF